MAADSITLHSSWRGIGLAYGGAATLMVLVLVAVVGEASTVVSIGVGLAAVSAMLVVLLDLPIATTFTAEGVLRRAVLRKHRISWDRIRRVSRFRKGLLSFVGGGPGGLVAEVGLARQLLVDVCESQVEFDEIRRILGTERAIALGFTDETRPPDGTKPTWLHRRDRWRPAS